MKFSKNAIIGVIFASMVCLPQALWAGGNKGGINDVKWQHSKGSYQAGE